MPTYKFTDMGTGDAGYVHRREKLETFLASLPLGATKLTVRNVKVLCGGYKYYLHVLNQQYDSQVRNYIAKNFRVELSV